jgi:hypothetical protein
VTLSVTRGGDLSALYTCSLCGHGGREEISSLIGLDELKTAAVIDGDSPPLIHYSPTTFFASIREGISKK